MIFSLDFRHTSEEVLQTYKKIIEEGLPKIAKEHAVEVELHQYMDGLPVPMDSGLVELIRKHCEEQNYNFKVMHSGAGHDAQIFAPFCPTGMIFVPSIKGISHNPAEWTEYEDLAKGVEVLTEVLHKVAY